MSAGTTPPMPHLHADDHVGLRREWVWFLILGIALVVMGMMAIGSAFVATLATVTVLGVLLLAAGIVQVVSSFWSPRWGGLFVHLLIGLLYAVTGFLVLECPVSAAAALTMLMAAFFIVGGLFRIAGALMVRFHGWAWDLLNGAITLLLGVIIWRNFPEATFWVIGVFVGVEMIFAGWTWIMFSLLAKNLPHPPAQSPVA